MDNIHIDLIRKQVDTIILKTLEERPKYGLQILNEIKLNSRALYALKQPTLYNCLKRLEKQLLIESFPGEVSNGARRVYYRLTEQGFDTLRAQKTEWEFSRTIMDGLLSDRRFDPETDQKPFDVNEFRPMTKRARNESEDSESASAIGDDKVVLSKEEYELLQQIRKNFDESKKESVSPPPFKQNEILQQNIKTRVSESDLFFETKNGQRTLDFDAILAMKQSKQSQHGENANLLPNIGRSQELGVEKNYNQLNTQEKITKDLSEQNPAQKPSFNQQADFQRILKEVPSKEDVNYISVFDNMFDIGKKECKTEAQDDILPTELALATGIEAYEEMNFTKLRNKLYGEHIKLKPYVKSNTIDYYTGKYYFSNRLLRDCSWALYSTFALAIVILFFALPRSVQLNPYWTFGILGGTAIFPLGVWIRYKLNPMRRSRTNFNFGYAMLTGVIAALACAVLIVLLSFFVFFADITKPMTMVKSMFLPLGSLFFIPFGILIYAMLYRTKRYHLG